MESPRDDALDALLVKAVHEAVEEAMARTTATGALSIDQFAERYAIGRTLVFDLLRRGEIRSFKAGRSRRLIPVAEAEAWVRRQVEEQSHEKSA